VKRYLVATRKSAALSGALLGSGLPALEAVQAAMRITPDIVQIQFCIALAVLFFVPVPFFLALTFLPTGIKTCSANPIG
jgi:hypothetical protein